MDEQTGAEDNQTDGDSDHGQTEPTTYASAALGFRAWAIVSEFGLASIGDGFSVWRPGINLAYCRHHLAPQGRCVCGLYALHSAEAVVEESQRYIWSRSHIVGAVASRGNLSVHYSGYRAEESVIVALALVPGSKLKKSQAEQVAALYQVPLVEFDQLESYGQRFAQPISESLRPAPPFKSLKDNQRSVQQIELAQIGEAIAWAIFIITALAVAAGLGVINTAGSSHYLFSRLWLVVLLFGLAFTSSILAGLGGRKRTKWIGLKTQRFALVSGFLGAVAGTVATAVLIGSIQSAKEHKSNHSFAQQVVSWRTDHGHWPRHLEDVSGYDSIVGVYPNLTGFVEGKCYYLSWSGGHRRLCLQPAHQKTSQTKG